MGPPVARSLEEAGLELLTFYTFPKTMWKSVRTTNALENLNRAFRRRTKTQASFSTEAAALTVLFGLVAVGQIVFRQIDGHQDLAGHCQVGVNRALLRLEVVRPGASVKLRVRPPPTGTHRCHGATPSGRGDHAHSQAGGIMLTVKLV